jgi:peroxiredoxin
MIRHWTRQFALLLAGVLLLPAVRAPGDQESAAHFRLPDLTGREVELFRPEENKATVFLFVATDCPVSNRYAPEARRLFEEFAPRHVAFWLVYADRKESTEAIRRHIQEFNYAVGVVRDPEHRLVKMTGARVTPEAVVFVSSDSGPQMVYRGRIDNRYVDFGKTRPAPTTHDLEEVLREVLAGKPLTLQTTRAIGCFIPKLQ